MFSPTFSYLSRVFHRQAYDKHCEDDVKRKDMKMILQLDQKVMDQQVMLEKAGVPGFYVTNNSQEIRIQILEYIVRLSQVDVPS